MIIHKVNNPAGWTSHPNAISEDRRISWRAKGILHYLLSRPPGWETDGKRISQQGKEGRDAVYTALGELERAGYLHRPRRQGAAGTWATDVYVYDHPQQHLIATPQLVENVGDNSVDDLGTTGAPSPENPGSENPDSLTSNQNNKRSPSQTDHRGGAGALVENGSAAPSGRSGEGGRQGRPAPAASVPSGPAESDAELALDDSDLRAIARMANLEPALSMFALRAHLRAALEDDSIDMDRSATWARIAGSRISFKRPPTPREVLAVAIDSHLPTTAREGSTALSEGDGLPADVS